MPRTREGFFNLRPNFRPKTVKLYRTAISQLHGFVKHKPWRKVTASDIISFLKTKNTACTKRKYCEVIKSFLKWVHDDDLPKDIRRLAIEHRRKKLRPSDLPTPEETRRLIDNMPTLREQTALALLYGTGARIGELLSTRVGDIEEFEGDWLIRVDGKTGENEYFIKSEVLLMLRKWLQFLNASPETPLFPTRRKPIRALTPTTFRKYLEEARQKAGIMKRIYPHLFRHLRNTELLKSTDRTKAKRIMGYPLSSNAFDGYVHLSLKDKHDAFRESEGKLSTIPSECNTDNTLPQPSYQHPLTRNTEIQELKAQLAQTQETLNEMTDKVILLFNKLQQK